MNPVMILVCFAFPGHAEECDLYDVGNADTSKIEAACAAVRRDITRFYPEITVTQCELWDGVPLDTVKT